MGNWEMGMHFVYTNLATNSIPSVLYWGMGGKWVGNGGNGWGMEVMGREWR